jgi:large subunit ribosomal protein L29
MENNPTLTIDEKILDLAKKIVQLKMKKATRQAFKPHEFKMTKRELSKLLTLQNTKK